MIYTVHVDDEWSTFIGGSGELVDVAEPLDVRSSVTLLSFTKFIRIRTHLFSI